MLPKRTLNVALLVVGVVALALGLARSAPAASQEDADTAAKIANAMSAAPAAVAEHATIVDYEVDDAGKFVVLREGTNGWTCLPDYPDSPGPDPWCFDQAWLDWVYAWLAGEEPNVTVPGFSYMLQGGSDPSNSDPFATAPAEGEEWVSTPPHIMLLLPEGLDQTVFTTDHESGGPYIMYAGTSFEHIMVPVTEAAHEG